MTCRKVASRLADYSANLLSRRERARLEHHLQTCSRCRAEWKSYQAVFELVESVESRTPPADMWAGLSERLESSAARQRREGASRAADPGECGWVRARLGRYSAGALSERNLNRFEGHLSVCTACGREWKSFSAVFTWIESLPDESPPPFLWARVRDRIQKRSARPKWVGLPRLAPAFAGGMAVVALLAFAVMKHHAPPEPPRMAAAQVTSNLVFLQQHAAMAQSELFSDKTALGTLINYVPAADEGR